ncbi:MAG: hypothetical protein M1825_000124 [Sarcosagium campestre]|nr:MAG: hypothetical protein M1825_000124 [Sarcosagium campestre]
MSELPDAGNHEAYIRLAIGEALKSPPKPTNFRVGAVLVDMDTNTVLSTGYTLELPGNTHAEQCCLMKFASEKGILEGELPGALPDKVALYTTMEPCAVRLSGNTSCVDRILQSLGPDGRGIRVICSGVQEPVTFVRKNEGRAKLESAGVRCLLVEGFEDQILSIAKAGHAVAP